jgi:DNA-directed RNA polymerase subunit L
MPTTTTTDEAPPDPSLVTTTLAQTLLLGTTPKLSILPNATPKSASFAIAHEDHTLGNALRYFICKNPDVEFCGYTIPHPSESMLSVRVQVWGKC